MSDYLDQLKQLEAEASAGADIMAEAVALGQSAVRDADMRRIVIGTLAGLVERRFNEASVQTFADRIGAGLKAVRQYESVVRFYGKDTCVAILTGIENISYTHLRAAMRKGNRDAALSLVADAADNDWPVSVTEAKAGKTTSEWLTLIDLDRAEVRATSYREGTVTLTLFIGDAENKVRGMEGETLHITLKKRVVAADAAADAARDAGSDAADTGAGVA